MIPINLTLKGIYSYQNKEQTIDFNHLSSAGLFGIFGSVGSGKSTILEAISYALYGETERLNRRENRGYNMMNLKSDNLLIDFIFKNGSSDQQYRFVVKGRRNTKRFEDVKTLERAAFKQMRGNWISIEPGSVEEITGLNYVNFRRTIIIPQGRFQEFLQLGDTDRTRMMKELFHLERFELSQKTKMLEDKNQKQQIKVEGQLLQLKEISKERIEEIMKNLEQLTAQMKQNQQKLKEKEVKEAELKALSALFEKIKSIEKEFVQLNLEKSEIEQLKIILKEYQYCLIHFKNKFEKQAEDKNKSMQLEKELLKAKKQFDELIEELEKPEHEFSSLKKQFDAKESMKSYALALEKIVKVKQLNAEIADLVNRLEKGKETLENTIFKIKKLEKEREGLKFKIQQLKDNQLDIAELAEIKAWYSELASHSRELTGIELQIENDQSKKELQKNEIISLSGKSGFETKTVDADGLQNYFSNALSGLETEMENTDNELKHLKVKQELSQYSEKLGEGEACPVCGSTHHPEKMHVADLSEKMITYEKKQQLIKSAIKKLNESEKVASRKFIEYQSINNQLIKLAEKKELITKNIDKHQKTYAFELKYTEQEVEHAFAKAEKEKSELDNLDININKLEKQLAKEAQNKEKYQAAINQLSNELASKQASCEILLEQTELDDKDSTLELSDNELKSKIEKLNSAYQKLVTDYELAEKTISKLKSEKDKLHGIIETKTADFIKLNEELKINEQKLQDEIFASKYESFDEISGILAKQYDIDLENQKIQTFENKLFSQEEQLLKLRQESKNKHFNKEEFELLLQELETVKKAINQQNKQLGSLENDKKEQENKLVVKESLNNEFEKLNLRGKNIKIMKTLFKGSGFVNYVSSVYLQNLVNAANTRFSALTGQKLRLELTETNDFIIRDFLNEGKTRSVKTLSGGQTFQASLSLALALADNIQSVTKSEHNFFFLDEGFGSLDKESLAVVFQSLKSLRKENRVVGIISHVEELQQEIDSYLKIENDAETGSKIVKSWE